jgi:hypothetical protein
MLRMSTEEDTSQTRLSVSLAPTEPSTFVYICRQLCNPGQMSSHLRALVSHLLSRDHKHIHLLGLFDN